MVTLQVTPSEDSHVHEVLLEVAEIDEELEAITRNQSTLTRSAAARHDEYESLKTRFPGIAITSQSTVRELYKALYAFRMQRASTALPIMDRKVAASNAKLCERINDLKKSRETLEESDGYKNADLQSRIDLRRAFDDVIAEYGASCP